MTVVPKPSFVYTFCTLFTIILLIYVRTIWAAAMLEYPNLLLMLLNIILFECFTDWHVVNINCEIKTNLPPVGQLNNLFRSFPTNFVLFSGPIFCNS
jgi:membrane-bound metal-dependent hydrolase YbcI (DUF457 family)